MAGYDFPPNLDDGEHWLPSNVFPEEIYDSNHLSSSKLSPEFPSELTYMEDLARQLAFASMLDQKTSKLPPTLVAPPQVKPGRFVTAAPPSSCFPPFYPPVFDSRTLGSGSKPVQTHAPARIRSYPQNQTRPLPFRVNGPRMGGGVNRESSGTGVFFPRVYNNDLILRKKPSMKGSEELQGDQSAVKEKQGMSCQSSAEMRLPQEWTY